MLLKGCEVDPGEGNPASSSASSQHGVDRDLLVGLRSAVVRDGCDIVGVITTTFDTPSRNPIIVCRVLNIHR